MISKIQLELFRINLKGKVFSYIKGCLNCSSSFQCGRKLYKSLPGVQARCAVFFRSDIWSFYPPGSMSVALQLGVHLILLYFIRIWLWVRRLFFYFDGWWLVDGGVPLFGFWCRFSNFRIKNKLKVKFFKRKKTAQRAWTPGRFLFYYFQNFRLILFT